MYLNTLKSTQGTKKTSKRLGRGIGSGKGKTSGRGHKGQKARSGGYHKVGFEGGQMPLQRRLPKFGFRSRKSQETQVLRLSVLEQFKSDEITLNFLKSKELIGSRIKRVKIILDEPVTAKIKVKGLKVSAGAKSAIESVGGKVEE